MNGSSMKLVNGAHENGCETHWWPEKYLQNSSEKYAIIVLNRPISNSKFESLWNAATLRCCVDGGMNRLLDFMATNQCDLKPPEIFSGDFDSCLPESMEYARTVNCQIIETPDQNETDFTKALRSISLPLKERDIDSVVVVCETSGRLDQIMANINTLFKSRKILSDTHVCLFSSNSLTWLLHPGTHVIHIPQLSNKKWCGLVPFCKTQVSTQGLKWNLCNSYLEFGGMVSTSNTYAEDAKDVHVSTENTILWTMGIAEED